MKSSPAYRTPTFDEMTAAVPNLVNDRWLVLALRDQVRASRKGAFLPWNGAQLLARAATRIERLSGPRRRTP